MGESYKNREGFNEGDIVAPAFDRFTKRKGKVLEVAEDGRLIVKWFDHEFISGVFLPAELRLIQSANKS